MATAKSVPWLAIYLLLAQSISITFAGQVPMEITHLDPISKTKDFESANNSTEQSTPINPNYIHSETDPIYDFNDQLEISWRAQAQVEPIASLQCWSEDSVLFEKTSKKNDNVPSEAISIVPIGDEKMGFLVSLQQYRRYPSCRWLLEVPAHNRNSVNGKVLMGSFQVRNAIGRQGRKWSVEVSESEEVEVLEDESERGMAIRRWKVVAEAGPI